MTLCAIHSAIIAIAIVLILVMVLWGGVGSQNGRAALIRASANGHVETVRLLLDRGADVNERDNMSTCECTDVIVSLVCLCLVLLVCLSRQSLQ